MLNVSLLVLIQVTFEQASSIQLDPDSLSNNLSGIHEVIQDVVVDSLQCAGSGPLLLQLVCFPCWLSKDGVLIKCVTLQKEFHIGAHGLASVIYEIRVLHKLSTLISIYRFVLKNGPVAHVGKVLSYCHLTLLLTQV